MAIVAGDDQLAVLAECGFGQVDGLHFGGVVVAADALNGVYLVVALRRVQLDEDKQYQSVWMVGGYTLESIECVPWQRLAPGPWCRRAG